MSLFAVFASSVLPVLVMAGAGYVLGRRLDVRTDSLNTVTVYVLAPALAFHSIALTDLGGATLARLVLGVTLLTGLMLVIAELVGRAAGVPEPLLSALVMTSAFANSGNYGIPLSSFSFGAVGRSTAVVYTAILGVLMYTVGVYVAARSGAGGRLGGLKQVLTVPLGYAVLAALAGKALGAVPPADSTAMETVGLVGDSAIPVMLLILGIELARTDYSATVGTVGTATVLKLAVAPALAALIALAIGFAQPTVGRVFVLGSATPAAITPLILIAEFGDDTPVDGVTGSEVASTVVLVTTLVSVLTVTPLIVLLRSGLLL